jgi:hypothetical protein
VGSIVHGLFEEIQELADFVPNFKSTQKTQYRPAEISITFEEKPFGANVPGLVSGVIPMFKMAKGFKPFMTENQLALLTHSRKLLELLLNHSLGHHLSILVPIVKKNNAVIDDFEIEEADADRVIFLISVFR